MKVSKADRAVRERVSRSHPFVACAECNNGWVGVTGIKRYATTLVAWCRCRCFVAHMAKIDRLVAEVGTARTGDAG